MKTATPPSPSGGSRGAVMVDVARLAGVSQKTVSRWSTVHRMSVPMCASE